MSSVWGNKIKVSIFGESHGPAVGCVIDGFPSGFEVNFEEMKHQLWRRSSSAHKDLYTSRKECDYYEIVSGIKNKKTNGTPICVIFKNKDVKSENYQDNSFIPRPGTADYTNFVKHGLDYNFSGSGHSSARLTLPLTFAGSLVRQLLDKKHNIKIVSHIESIKNIKDTIFNKCDIDNSLIEKLNKQSFPVINNSVKDKFIDLITKTRRCGDTLGGTIECAILRMPPGFGNPFFDSIESKIASAMFSIPAVKGIEFGSGFELANMNGSQANDAFYFDESGMVKTKTNNSGGILGGISNGMPITFRVAFKPIPSILLPQSTVNLSTKQNTEIYIEGRHDCCTVLRAAPIVEASSALAIADLIL